MPRPLVENHPRYDEIVRRLRAGEEIKIVAASVGIRRDTLSSWWRRQRVERSGKFFADNVQAFEAAEALAELKDADGDSRALARALVDQRRQTEDALQKERATRLILEELEQEFKRVSEIASLLEPTHGHRTNPPKWLTPKPSSKAHRGTVNLVLSDLHLDEVVRPEEVNFVNAYNRRIAELRLRRTFEKACTIPRDYLAGIAYDGIVLHLAGDTFSGDIHEELAQSNEDHAFGSLLYWLDHFIAGIRMLVEVYGKVHIVSVPGNHDRTTRKPIHKGRVMTSLHYLFSKMLEREFKGDKRVTWDIPQTPDVITRQYNFTTLTTHGDRFRGGQGIGGILVPILRGDARMRQRQQAVEQPYDLLVMGHFHQYVNGPGVLINGSLKGYDEYAFNNAFAFEPPQQALFVVTPEQGDMLHLPIRCMKKGEERWSR